MKRILLGAAFVLFLSNTAWAQCSEPYFVEQAFPVGGAEETRWRICWQSQGKHGGASATDPSTLVSTETGLEWKADEFTTLHVHDSALKNSHGQASMYHLMPLRWGRPRHQEGFSKSDFWVTLYKGSELWAKDLTSYISNGENVANADVVVWYMGAVHHPPRAEDGESVNGTFRGSAHLMWTGWLLKPHNLFDRTPLFERR